MGEAQNTSLLDSTCSRLETFSNCQLQPAVSISEWAQCGFIYNASTQTVKCVSCEACVVDWCARNSATVDTRHHKAGCMFAFNEIPVAADDDGASLDHCVQLPHNNSQRLTSEDRDIDVDRLREENSRLKATMKCRNCKTAPIETLFLPCRHLVSCEICAETVDDCFLCNASIKGTVRAYLNVNV